MHETEKKKVAAMVWPKYSVTVDLLNQNAKLVEWIKGHENGDIKCFRDRFDMYRLLNHDVVDNGPICYLEFGVWEGESLAGWAAINTNSNSRFYGFDSFQGLPEDLEHAFGRRMPKKRFDLKGNLPTFDDSRITLVNGWFQHTLHSFLTETPLNSRLVIHNDSDLYSSTMYVLTALDKQLKPGDVIVFDEFTSPINEFRAWQEYLRCCMRTASCVAMSDNWRQVSFVFD
jgi:hypothetical protein